MRLKFLGAAGEVTGSCFVVELDNEQLMIDCGMFQGIGAEEKNRAKLEVELESLTGVAVTHAHLDHCGRLPVLVKGGFKDFIYTTGVTRDLAEIVLFDAAKIGAEGEGTMIYGEMEVSQTLRQWRTKNYGERFGVGKHFKVRFLDAGHILGSASVEVEAEGKRLIFSGDLGNEPSPIVKPIERPQTADVVVMETTYGDRLHPKRGEEEKVLEELTAEILRTGGTLLVPAFSLEKTQELLLAFDRLKKRGLVAEELPVYLDSPMALRATAIFEKYPEYFNLALRRHYGNDDPFDFPRLELVESVQESKRINGLNRAKVIIAGSGMMSGGRMMHHAARWLPDPKTILLLTSYQAEGTLGRELLDGERQVVINGRSVEVKARVEQVTTMSAHADQAMLEKWLKGIKGVGQVVLVHGEEEVRQEFGRLVKREGLEIFLPQKGEIIHV